MISAIDRPAWNYMHWGFALHTCSGQYINQVQIPAILQPLVARRTCSGRQAMPESCNSRTLPRKPERDVRRVEAPTHFGKGVPG